MWSILVNSTDSDSDKLPLLITRNIDVESLNQALKAGITSHDFSTRVKFSEPYGPPFASKCFVLIRKNGKSVSVSWKYATLGTIFGRTEIPPRSESEPSLIYLHP
jgi:hypothetical protein